MHGMSAAFLCGEPGLDRLLGKEPRASIGPDRLDLFGIRSIDPLEKKLVFERRVAIADMRAIDEFGVGVLIRKVIERVRARNGVLHVSFDVDFLDPAVAPGVGTTVPGGATYREAHLIMELLHDSGLVRSVDIVELNPFLDERGRTARVAVELIGSLFGLQITDRPDAEQRGACRSNHSKRAAHGAALSIVIPDGPLRTDPRSRGYLALRDSPMCNCTSEVRARRPGMMLRAYSAASFRSGAAARTSASTWASNLAKFFWNMPTSARAVLSNSALSFQVLTGSRISLGTPGSAVGTAKPKYLSVRNSTLRKLPSSAAVSSARVTLIGIRVPVPYLPPVQPVLTSQQSTLCLAISSRSMLP